MIICKNREIYTQGDKVVCLVNHSPIIEVGTIGRIVNRWNGTLYAVKLPNGEIYKWLNDADLVAVDTSQHILRVGDLALINSDRHQHLYHPFLKSGIVVQVVKIIETDYYAVKVGNERSHYWFAGFEISTVV